MADQILIEIRAVLLHPVEDVLDAYLRRSGFRDHPSILSVGVKEKADENGAGFHRRRVGGSTERRVRRNFEL
jgi:hypothetical protein